jgi:hypothetical protein
MRQHRFEAGVLRPIPIPQRHSDEFERRLAQKDKRREERWYPKADQKEA